MISLHEGFRTGAYWSLGATGLLLLMGGAVYALDGLPSMPLLPDGVLNLQRDMEGAINTDSAVMRTAIASIVAGLSVFGACAVGAVATYKRSR